MSKVYILPYGIEHNPNCTISTLDVTVKKVPKDIGDCRYLSYFDIQGQNWYLDSGNSYEQLSASNKDQIIIENPIFNMSVDEVMETMYDCMNQQSDEWLKNYVEEVKHLYNLSVKNSSEPDTSNKLYNVLERCKAAYKFA